MFARGANMICNVKFVLKCERCHRLPRHMVKSSRDSALQCVSLVGMTRYRETNFQPKAFVAFVNGAHIDARGRGQKIELWPPAHCMCCV